MSTNEWIVKMKDAGLITDTHRVAEFCEHHKLEIDVMRISVQCGEGQYTNLPVTDVRIQTCCGCDESFIISYGTCEECGDDRCYTCSVDGASFYHCAKLRDHNISSDDKSS